MKKEERQPAGGPKKPGGYEHYDLTEEASKRPGQSGATEAARRAESDDANEETNIGSVNTPAGDNWAENKVATSDD
jgi:hypothetical protein